MTCGYVGGFADKTQSKNYVFSVSPKPLFSNNLGMCLWKRHIFTYPILSRKHKTNKITFLIKMSTSFLWLGWKLFLVLCPEPLTNSFHSYLAPPTWFKQKCYPRVIFINTVLFWGNMNCVIVAINYYYSSSYLCMHVHTTTFPELTWKRLGGPKVDTSLNNLLGPRNCYKHLQQFSWVYRNHGKCSSHGNQSLWMLPNGLLDAVCKRQRVSHKTSALQRSL